MLGFELDNEFLRADLIRHKNGKLYTVLEVPRANATMQPDHEHFYIYKENESGNISVQGKARMEEKGRFTLVSARKERWEDPVIAVNIVGNQHFIACFDGKECVRSYMLYGDRDVGMAEAKTFFGLKYNPRIVYTRNQEEKIHVWE